MKKAIDIIYIIEVSRYLFWSRKYSFVKNKMCLYNFTLFDSCANFVL